MSEFKLHCSIVKHIEDCFPEAGFFHPTNEQKDATSAFFGKMMGVKPGTSDLVIGWSWRNIGVLEVKLPTGRLSSPQNKFLSWAHSIGWSTGVAKSKQQAHDILCAWGLKPLFNEICEPDLRTDEQKRKDSFDFYRPT